MESAYRLEVAGRDVTAQFRDRLLSLVVTLTADRENDSLQLMLDDRDDRLPVPPFHAPLRVWLGCGSADQYLGEYLCSGIVYDIAPPCLTVCAVANDNLPSMHIGHPLPVVVLRPGDIVSGQITYRELPQYDAVEATPVDQGTADLCLPGRPGLCVGQPLRTEGWGDPIDRDWTLCRMQHNYSPTDGYQITLDASLSVPV